MYQTVALLYKLIHVSFIDQMIITDITAFAFLRTEVRKVDVCFKNITEKSYYLLNENVDSSSLRTSLMQRASQWFSSIFKLDSMTSIGTSIFTGVSQHAPAFNNINSSQSQFHVHRAVSSRQYCVLTN